MAHKDESGNIVKGTRVGLGQDVLCALSDKLTPLEREKAIGLTKGKSVEEKYAIIEEIIANRVASKPHKDAEMTISEQ
ncbi:MAG: hypothetical protein LBG88_04425 [Christensenellaceae bacterium]|jgi:hypothetical protein|nr:hypothetical protein [Christensenellaceae bacterium]